MAAAMAAHRNGDWMLDGLLALSRAIDWINDRFGKIATWMVLIATLISAGNAASRYLFSASSNAWLEIQWYLFAADGAARRALCPASSTSMSASIYSTR